MIFKIKNIFFLITFLIFSLLIFKKYFSTKNIIFTNKTRSSYSLNNNLLNLPILQNDTKDIYIYKNDLEEFNKNRKKRFWEKLINTNE